MMGFESSRVRILVEGRRLWLGVGWLLACANGRLTVLSLLGVKNILSTLADVFMPWLWFRCDSLSLFRWTVLSKKQVAPGCLPYM